MFFGPNPENIEEIAMLMQQRSICTNGGSHNFDDESSYDVFNYVVQTYGNKSVSELMEYIYRLNEFSNAKVGVTIL